MILILFLQFLIIAGDSYSEYIFKGKCEDDKAKTGACMYEIYDSKNQYTKYAIFKKCGKGEICDDEYCYKGVDEKKRKSGKSCNYDKDCISGSCVSNKCTVNKEGETCKNNNSCEPGTYCSYDSSSTSKCVKYAKLEEKAENKRCLPGLLKDKDNKCVKFGTFNDNEEIRRYDYIYGNFNYEEDMMLLCKSGLAHSVISDDFKNLIIKCDSIETEPECKEEDLIKTEGKWTDKEAINDGCKTIRDYQGTKINYNEKYSKLKSKLFSDFLEDYNDLDLNKISSDEKYSSWEDLMKPKTKEKWLLYRYANELKAAGIIDSDGKVVNDKKCEYEFLMKNYLHSNFIKFNTIIIAMIALLF